LTEPGDDFEAQLARTNRRRRAILATLAALVLAAFSWMAYTSYRRMYPPPRPVVTLTRDQRAEIAQQLRDSRAKLRAADRPWRAKIGAVDPQQVSPDAPRCTRLDFYRETLARHPQNWRGWRTGLDPFPELGEALSVRRHGSWSITSVPYPILLLPPGAPLPEHSAEHRFRLEDLEREERSLDHDQHVDFRRRLSAVRHTELYATEIVLRLLGSAAPRADMSPHASTFESGVLVAEGWMYDHRTNDLPCAGIVRVESSASVDLRSTGLNEDLIVNLIREAPGQLRALR
jgi:hypothetical protein